MPVAWLIVASDRLIALRRWLITLQVIFANGKTNLAQFNQAEHAGLCCAGEMLIGAYLVCCYAHASLAPGADAGTGQAGPASWEIDEAQERLVQQWAEAKQIWFANAEADIESEYGPMIATLGRALEAAPLLLTCRPATINRATGTLTAPEVH